MRHAFKSGWLVVGTACALLLPSPAAAQRATRNVFNGSVSASEAFDWLPAEFRDLLPEGTGQQSSSISTMLSGMGVFARNRRTLQLNGTGNVSFRQDPNHNGFEAVSNSGSFGAGVRLSQRSSLQLTQSATYSPLYLYQLFPTSVSLESGKLPAIDPGYRNDQTASYLYGTHVGVNSGSARGTMFAVTADYNLTDYQHQDAGRENLATYSIGGSLSQALSRAASVSFGYHYSPAEFGASGRSTEHRITIGATYSLALTPTRRATFSVNVSPTLMTIDNPLPLTNDPTDVATKHPAQWEANVEYPFTRKWRGGVRACWCVDYVAEAGEPLLSQGTWANLTGVIGSRVNVSAFAGYSTAASIAGTTQNVGTYTGGAQVSYAVSRILSVDTGYVIYQYDARNLFQATPGFPSHFNQNGVRVGFTLFARPAGR